MKNFRDPKTRLMRFASLALRLYLVSFIAGCAPTKPPATVAEARSMETRTVDAEYNKVFKASLNVLQDLYYSVDLVEAEIGLIQASRHTEGKQVETVDEMGQEQPPDWKKICGIAAVTVLVIGLITLLFSGSDDEDDTEEKGNAEHHYYIQDDDGPSGPVLYKYKVTVNLEAAGDSQTKVRVSAQGERLVGGSVVEAGPIQEPEFFQRFFASLDKSLFLEN
ncbi:MAG: hypothetical protein ACE5EE_01165 [Fidelibacterota bacterium]